MACAVQEVTLSLIVIFLTSYAVAVSSSPPVTSYLCLQTPISSPFPPLLLNPKSP